MGDLQSLEQGLRDIHTTTFDMAFMNEFYRRVKLTPTAQADEALDALRISIVKDLLQNPRYAHVLEYYLLDSPLTHNYNPLCKKALDFLARQHRTI